jgi:hypothetical protein
MKLLGMINASCIVICIVFLWEAFIEKEPLSLIQTLWITSMGISIVVSKIKESMRD